MNTFALNTYRDTLVDFTRDIYFDQDKHSWIVTNNEITKQILKSDRLLANSLPDKLANSGLNGPVRDRVADFYSNWLIYMDGERHQLLRTKVRTYLDGIVRRFSDETIKRMIINEMASGSKEGLVDFVEITQKICRQIMATVFGLKVEEYDYLVKISRPVTELLYGYDLEQIKAQKALDAIGRYHQHLHELTNAHKLNDNGFLSQALSDPEISLSLLINVLVDGEDPLESLEKSVFFLWGQSGLLNLRSDLKTIFSIMAPFTYISRIAAEDTIIDSVTVKRGQKISCIIPEYQNSGSPHHGSMAFGQGVHRCLGEPLAVKVAKNTYEILQAKKKQVKMVKYAVNNDFGYFTFTELLMEVN
ncbi:hypothetical protein [Lentilactobacillus otakiensis]|uniref:hypothetical protein n=1 Tax=Lentilactobacillus otakiensis TaxID=481720 RepID=UPI003D16BCD0